MSFKEYHSLTETLIKQIELAQSANDSLLTRVLVDKLGLVSEAFLSSRLS